MYRYNLYQDDRHISTYNLTLANLQGIYSYYMLLYDPMKKDKVRVQLIKEEYENSEESGVLGLEAKYYSIYPYPQHFGREWRNKEYYPYLHVIDIPTRNNLHDNKPTIPQKTKVFASLSISHRYKQKETVLDMITDNPSEFLAGMALMESIRCTINIFYLHQQKTDSSYINTFPFQVVKELCWVNLVDDVTKEIAKYIPETFMFLNKAYYKICKPLTARSANYDSLMQLLTHNSKLNDVQVEFFKATIEKSVVIVIIDESITDLLTDIRIMKIYTDKVISSYNDGYYELLQVGMYNIPYIKYLVTREDFKSVSIDYLLGSYMQLESCESSAKFLKVILSTGNKIRDPLIFESICYVIERDDLYWLIECDISEFRLPYEHITDLICESGNYLELLYRFIHKMVHYQSIDGIMDIIETYLMAICRCDTVSKSDLYSILKHCNINGFRDQIIERVRIFMYPRQHIIQVINILETI